MKNAKKSALLSVVAAAALSSVACAGSTPRVEIAEHGTARSDVSASAAAAPADGTAGNEHWKKMR